MPVAARLIGKQVCDALGLDASKVSKVSIHIEAGDIATVDVEMAPTLRQGKLICAVLKRYRLATPEGDSGGGEVLSS